MGWLSRFCSQSGSCSLLGRKAQLRQQKNGRKLKHRRQNSTFLNCVCSFFSSKTQNCNTRCGLSSRPDPVLAEGTRRGRKETFQRLAGQSVLKMRPRNLDRLCNKILNPNAGCGPVRSLHSGAPFRLFQLYSISLICSWWTGSRFLKPVNRVLL